MKGSGRRPGRKDSGRPGKAGKNDRNRRDRRFRDTPGNPFLWLAPFLLVVIFDWAVFPSILGYRTIDTSDDPALLQDEPDTIKLITVVDGNQRVEAGPITTYVQPKRKGIESRPVSKKAEFPYADTRAEQVDRLMQATAPEESFSSVIPTADQWSSLIQLLVSALLLSGFTWWILSRMGGGRGDAIGFDRSKAKVGSKGMPDVTFDDVAGRGEAVGELEETREFLSEPGKFRVIGAKTPKDVLLYSPSGIDKTLLAKAVAGEADVPFSSIAVSGLVEMFVDVGVSRVRNLFGQTKESAPIIIFADEINTVGRHRDSDTDGGHDECEQTPNQLLIEMDDFDTDTDVILITATNRPDVLDSVLLRPGRFDRQVSVEAPDMAGRAAILKVYTQGKPLNSDVDLELTAKRTPSFTGADLVNILNEAALLTVRSNAHLVDSRALDGITDRVTVDPQKRTHAMRDHEKRVTACYEAGHALCAIIGIYFDPVTKVTILPHGRALGYTRVVPQDDKYSATRNGLLDQLVYVMGGRAAEEITPRDLTTGVSSNIEKVTVTARKMVTDYDMTSAVGAVKLGIIESETVLGLDITSRNFSEQAAATVDTGIRSLLDTAHWEAWEILTHSRAMLDQLAKELLTRETLLEKDLERIFEGVIRQPERSL